MYTNGFLVVAQPPGVDGVTAGPHDVMPTATSWPRAVAGSEPGALTAVALVPLLYTMGVPLSSTQVPDIDDCADTSSPSASRDLDETPDAMSDDRAPTHPSAVLLADCGNAGISTLPKFLTTQSWEKDGVRWYFLVTGKNSAETFDSCGMTQLSCRVAA